MYTDTHQTLESLRDLFAEQTMKPDVQHVGTILATYGEAALRQCLMLNTDEELPDDDEYLVRISTPDHPGCTDWEHLPTIGAVCDWLREEHASGEVE